MSARYRLRERHLTGDARIDRELQRLNRLGALICHYNGAVASASTRLYDRLSRRLAMFALREKP
jgi:hypothetical protein